MRIELFPGTAKPEAVHPLLCLTYTMLHLTPLSVPVRALNCTLSYYMRKGIQVHVYCLQHHSVHCVKPYHKGAADTIMAPVRIYSKQVTKNTGVVLSLRS